MGRTYKIAHVRPLDKLFAPPYTVTVEIQFPSALSPIEAVQMFLDKLREPDVAVNFVVNDNIGRENIVESAWETSSARERIAYDEANHIVSS